MGVRETVASREHPSVVTMTSFWCEQAWLGGERAVDGVTITLDGDRIAGCTAGVASPPGDATRLDGLTIPGVANAHSHAFHRALRGRTHRGGGSFWTWRDHMYQLAASLGPDHYEELATATFAEMVVSGYTCVGEFHYLHHGAGGASYADPNEFGRRLIVAASRAGIRLTLLDTCYLAGGIGVEPNDVQRRFSDGSAGAWSERSLALMAGRDAGYRVGAAIHSVRAVDPDSMTLVARWAVEHGTVLHAHVSEQPLENADCLDVYGCTPVELMSRTGALSDRFTAVHATHLAPGDVNLLASMRSRCCICATTERDLADGIGPTAALRDADVALCLGSDSHAMIDPFEEMRAIEMDERLASGQRGIHQATQLLEAATATGYASIGWPEGGVIAVGNLADFVTVGFDSARLAGADRDDVVAAVVFGATASDVTDVVVGGEHIVRDGVHRSIDVVASLGRSIRRAWAEVER